MLKLDKNTTEYFKKNGVRKIKVYFYTAGCSGTKIDIKVDDFEVDDTLENINLENYPFLVYIDKKDQEKLEYATITGVIKADHTGIAKPRYIYTSESVLERCGCGTSFAFEKKKPKFDFTKLKFLKQDFEKKDN